MDSATVSTSDLNIFSLYRGVVVLRKFFDRFYNKLLEIIPIREGTAEWWRRESELSLNDYRNGRYTTYSSVDKYVEDLRNREVQETAK